MDVVADLSADAQPVDDLPRSMTTSARAASICLLGGQAPIARNRRAGRSRCGLRFRVEAEVRDRLAALAATHGRSLGAELRAMLDEMTWQGIEAGHTTGTP